MSTSLAPEASRRRRELWVFFILAIAIWPVIAVGLVSGWGFLVWIYYSLAGPPGPV